MFSKIKLRLFLFIFIGLLGLCNQLYIRPWIYEQDFSQSVKTLSGSFPSFCSALAIPLVILVLINWEKKKLVLLGIGIGLSIREILSLNSQRSEFGFTFDCWDLVATWFGILLAWKLHRYMIVKMK